MALVKYGGGIVQASGSIAGNTYARNRFGNYIRPRTKPVNPNSIQQSAVRTSLSYLAQYWAQVLSAAERSAWATYAASIAMKNRLGETVYLTGFNHFLRSNIELARHALTIVDAGPTELELPEKDTTFAIVCTADDQKIIVTFNNALGWAGEVGGELFVYQGQPQLITRNFFNGPWKYTGKVDGSEIPPTTGEELDAAMTLVEGQKVFCYSRIARADGRLSEPMYASAVVLATAPV